MKSVAQGNKPLSIILFLGGIALKASQEDRLLYFPVPVALYIFSNGYFPAGSRYWLFFY